MEINSKVYPNTKGNLIDRTLYQICADCEIVFEEKQDDDTIDILKVQFYTQDNPLFFYAKEYIPSIVSSRCAKDVDVSIIRLDKETKCIIYKAIDLKRNLITNARSNELLDNINITHRTLSHLVAQWNDSYTYAKLFQIVYHSYDLQFIPYVVTRNYSKNELEQLINTYKKQQEEDIPIRGILAKKEQIRELKVNKQIQLLQMFLEGFVELHEEFFNYKILLSEEGQDNQFIYHMNIE